jgi:lysophospholipase L1-like esterase
LYHLRQAANNGVVVVGLTLTCKEYLVIPFQHRQNLLFIGDSITDCGRREDAARLGNGYVWILHNFLRARYPELELTISNRGVSGDTTRHLAARWQKDVIDRQPAFGDNLNEAVPLPEYEATLRRLLDWALLETPARLILIEPYMIEPDQSRPMRREMDRYGSVVRRLAGDYGALLVPAQAAFDRVLKHTSPGDWSDDQIHPNAAGHTVIAVEFLRAVGAAL